MSQPTILVTGATGTVGGALVSALISTLADAAVAKAGTAASPTVLAGSRDGRAVGAAAGRSVDFTDAAALARSFEGVDRLFLLFPLVPGKRDLARNALQAARAAGVEHIVRSSGAGADAHATSSLARLQGDIDAMVLDAGIPATILRPETFMQNWVHYYAGMIKAGTLYAPLAEGRTAYIDVRDIAAVAAAVLRDPTPHAGQAYTLTGPQALGVADGLAEIARITGRQATYVPVTEEAAAQSMKGMGMDDWTIDILTSLNRDTAAGKMAQVTPEVERLTGHAARSFAQFVQDHAQAWR